MDRLKNLLGAIPSPRDDRDYSIRVMATAFPATYDVRDVPVYDQGQIGNCVMQALRSAPHTATGIKPGCTFGYGRWRSSPGSGMRPNEAANGFVKEGIPPEADDKQYLEMPEAASYAEQHKSRLLAAAEPFKGWTWARLHDISEIKATLLQEATRRGIRCIVCLPYVGISDDYWHVDGAVQGYHEMAIVGWDDAKGFKLRNSWGLGFDGTGGGLLGGNSNGDGYVWCAFADIFACNDVIALFPPTEDKPKPDPAPIVIEQRTLRLKDPYMRGDDVRECQARLIVHGFPVTADGVFGVLTSKAVRLFQRSHSLAVDGLVGAKTWAALRADPDKHGFDPAELTKILAMSVGDDYVIGGQGHEMTLAYLEKRIADKPEYFTNGRGDWLKSRIKLAASLGRKLYCTDCSGLLMKANEIMGFIPVADATADTIYNAYCTPIALDEVRPGDILFKRLNGAMTHMAVVGTDGVYEAAGTAYGVVFRPWQDMLSRRTWNRMTGKFDTLGAWTHAGRLN